MKIRLFGILLLLVVGAAALFVALRPQTASGQQSQYLTATAARRTITSDAVATGNVAFSTVYGLSFGASPTIVSTATSSSSSSSSSSAGGGSASWTVKDVKATLGTAVRKGDVLATASAPDLTAQLNAADNQLRAAENNLANADDGVNNLTSSSTTAQVRAAWNAVYQARSAVQSQQQTISELKTELSNATLKAPVSGVVVAVNAVAGLPAPSGVAIEVGAAPMEVVGQYAESDLSSLALGQPATVSVSATGSSVQGKVVAIAPTASTSGGSSSVVTYDVTIQLDNPPAQVKPGMSADVSITTASAANVLAVPAVALSGSADGYTVDVMAADGSLRQVPVQVGLVTSSWAEIQDGLSEGDVVVTGTTSPRNSTTTTGGFGGFGGIGGFGGGAGNFRGNGGGTNRGNGGPVTNP
jgi:macrolide-specific efflux system membrane fusion protein